MSGQVQLITLGGTLLMKPRGEQGLEPFYSVQDVVLEKALALLAGRRVPAATKEKLRAARALLMEQGAASYPEIGRLMSGSPALSDAEALDVVRINCLFGTEAALGYQQHSMAMPYGPIDSINFDRDMHYPALREAVLTSIRNGDVPVIAGGTDTLRYYGTLLQEDLAQLHASGQIPHLPPVILVSSMHAFGEPDPQAQRHVYRLLKAARIAADDAVIAGKSGVFALLAADAQVSSASLLDLSQPCDKISATLTKAFVGTEILNVDPNRPIPGDAYPHYDPRRHADGMAPQIAPLKQRLVAPPLEAGNRVQALAQVLYAVRQYPASYPFDALILKGELPEGDTRQIKQLVAELVARGVDVFCMNDPRYDAARGALHAAPMPRPHALEEAGAIAAEGLSSTQLFVRAGMEDAQGAPVHFAVEREAAQARAQAYATPTTPDFWDGLEDSGVKRHLRNAAPALAVEYMPDAQSYGTLLDVVRGAGIKTVVSVNCTDGSMAEHHAEALRRCKRDGVQVVASFKYAGEPFDAAPESASMTHYGPAVSLRRQGLVQPGLQASPAELLARAQQQGRGA